ncbi:GAF domain-containing protein [Acuticoccus sediminis]|uniref:GAF domain-containing protein n=1 Tax=Acuticoccus sediminis TaxID=2184697 RepID=UPI001CFD7170|nr:GAF domain-containing protein [Acuticoccus sediminis]
MPRVPAGPALDRLAAACRDAAGERDLEAAFAHLTGAALETLGDPDAALRPGALKEGERDYRVSGVFLVTPDGTYNMLVASQGFPAEQRRLAIPIAWNHPGEVVRTGRPILLENTDDHGQFRQFLKTSRMGSALYHPIHAGGALVGQIIAASQARRTYDADDLVRLSLLAAAAALVWTAADGPGWLAADYPAPDLWRSDVRSLTDEGA